MSPARRRQVDIALVSCARLPEPDPDAAPLAAALDAAGLAARVLGWDDPGADWSAARMTVLRSSWNYPLHASEFLAWARAVAGVTELWNRLEVIEWSLHKSYLLDLARRGIPVAPTELVPRGSPRAAVDIAGARGWDDIVIKPAVSAASFKTRRFAMRRADEREAADSHLRALAGDRDVLLQQYLSSVQDHGERAVVCIDGQVTHAVRKSPRFEGQSESVSPVATSMSPSERALAERAIAAAGAPLLYGRVDMAPGPDGHPVLMELELIEPSLYFAQCQGALDRFVAAIRRRLDGHAVTSR